MATFIYNPQIRVRIALDGSKKADDKDVSVVDISEDLVQGTLSLRTNGVHTFNFQLQNAMRKYDGMIQPMDRITIEMKRVTWVRVFSGYLNNGPIFSAFPRVLQLSASCTLKRLQFWFWDPTTTTAFNLLTQMTNQQGDTTTPQDNPDTPNDESRPAGDAGDLPPGTPGAPGTPPAAGGGAPGASPGPAVHAYEDQEFDDSIKGIVVKILTEVVGWPQEKVHIGAIPAKWIEFAQDIGNKILRDADQSKYIGDLALAAATLGGAGTGTAVNGQIQAGTFGGVNLNQEQANIASQVLGIAKGARKSDNVCVAMMCCLKVESNMTNVNHGTGSSVGIFQLIAAHGSVAERMDIGFSTRWWLGECDRKAPVPRQDTMEVGALSQLVEVSGFPGRYSQFAAMGRDLVAAFNRSVGAGAGVAAQNGGAMPNMTPPGTPGAPAAPGAPAGAPAPNSGRKFASVAHGVIASKPPGHIRYQMGNDDPYNSPDPRVLDCSSFVDLVYYRVTGRGIQQSRTTAAYQQGWVGPTIPVELARSVKGALVFNGRPATHVEVSLGNGQSAAARTDSRPLATQVSIDTMSGGDSAGLVPGMNYADAATNPQAAAQLSQIVGYPVTPSDPNEFGPGAAADAAGAGAGGTGIDPFNALLNIYTWGFNVNVSGDNYAGPRAMMNDTPLLPYIANLLSASMRSWCSAPNGDFMAWFPDYFGIFGTAGKMNVRTIELQDFTVEWNDQKIVTHQYVIGSPNGFVNQATGSISGTNTDASGNALTGASSSSLVWELTTGGIATMEYPEIFRMIFGQDATPDFLKNYLSRFGGRPDMVNMPALKQGLPEFFMALYLFMQRWAAQFKAVVPMTFMPELWPGMLLALPDYNFQAYITEVQHTFRFGQGGGFQTQAAICAPAKTDASDPIFGLLPLGGKTYWDEIKKANDAEAERERERVRDLPLPGPGAP